MDNHTLPIRVTEICQLRNVGVPIEHVTWPRVTLSSDGWICVRHCKHPHMAGVCPQCVARRRAGSNGSSGSSGSGNGAIRPSSFRKSLSLERTRSRSSSRSPARRMYASTTSSNGTSSSSSNGLSSSTSSSTSSSSSARSLREKLQCRLTLLNLHLGGTPLKWSAIADSVRKNPVRPWLALKAGFHIEVYDMDSRALLRKHKCAMSVIFWAWASPDVIALVSEMDVYHWHLTKGSDVPQKVFGRHSRLRYSEIVNYAADDKLQWLALVGLLQNYDNEIQGIIQIYSVCQNLSQMIEGHSICFTRYKFDGNRHSSTVMCLASRGANNMGKIHVVEMGPHIIGNCALTNYSESLHYPEREASQYDFPVSIQVSNRTRLIYIVTKYGHLFLCELETGLCLCRTQISTDLVFAAQVNRDTQGLVAVSRNGLVFAVDIKYELIIEYINSILKKPALAGRMKSYMAVF